MFAAIGDDWDVEERLRAQLDRLGLADLAHGPPAGIAQRWRGGVGRVWPPNCSGVPTCCCSTSRPTTSTCDARHRLYAALDDFGGTLLVVSHDRVLLDRMDRIAELYRGEIVFYGGTFTDYEDALDAAQRVAEADVRNAESMLKREKRQMQQARERAARRSGTAARNVKNAGLPKIVAGKLKRDAQESAARSDDVHAKRVDDARSRLDEAERAMRDDDAIVLDLPDTDVPVGRTVLVARGLQISRGGRKLFGDNGIDLDIRGPERIALTGPERGGQVDAAADHHRRPATRAGRRRSGPTAGSPTCRSGWICSTPTAPWPRASPRSRPA